MGKKEDFIEFYKTHSTQETAKEFKITIPTVLKYARKFNLPVSKTGRAKGSTKIFNSLFD